MFMKTILIFLFAFSSINLYGKPQYVVINHHENEQRGFFSIMDYVFTCIDWMESYPEYYAGFEIDFKDKGLYYDARYGQNYWSYFFKPVQVGDPTNCKRVNLTSEFKGLNRFRNEELDKFIVAERVQRLMHLTDEMEAEIQNFIDVHFRDQYVIGLHYRGTDKKFEARRISYKEILREVLAEIEKSPENWHLFIATDEQPFLDYMIKMFPGRVSYLEGIERSNGKRAIHFFNKSPYLQGKSAVMDCVLLSRTDILLRTCSNLNRWSTYFNPFLKERELSKRHGS